MERLGSDELFSIYQKLHERGDRRSFSQVSKDFLKVTCVINIRLFVIVCPSLLNVILPGSPNLSHLFCHKPLSNEHMKLLAQYCPNLEKLNVTCSNFKGIIDHPEKYEFDFDDDGLCAVANGCTHLYVVILSGRLHVGDLGVVSLVRSLKNLTYLELARCVKITDESLKAIGEATCLKVLNLQDCYLITDLGLQYLANGDLKNCLQNLNLAGCVRVSDAGIMYLKQMVNLSYLELARCVKITDESLKTIGEATCLKVLNLQGCYLITDLGLQYLANGDLKNCLQHLHLAKCVRISIAGMMYLKQMVNLCYLDVSKCGDGIRDFVRANLRIGVLRLA